MNLLLASVAILVASGLAALLARQRPRMATALGVGGAVLGCGIGLVAVLTVLVDGSVEQIDLPWNVPFGSFHLRIDALSTLFLLPILGLAGIAAPYGGEYLLRSEHRGSLSIGASWLFYNLLAASMVMVVIAWNAVIFLVAWELMAIASFVLVTTEHEKRSVRDAGWIYLVSTHLGTAFLLVLFLLLGSNSLDFDRFEHSGNAGLLFLLALIGFGAKAGFVPLHVWLPEAHPAAPSHVSAVMSGVMIKTGIYGLIRTLTFIGPPPTWWAIVLIGLGLCSGVLGVLFALAQHDLKRLLAYHSVENIGIILLGLGMGMLGISSGNPALATLGFAGALLHVINHALFKGLLFLGAGSVLHATGSLEMDRLGGLLKRMPQTGIFFLIGSVAIVGLPPLNGFISEFLIYLGALHSPQAASPVIIGGLALIGGLAAACFAKVFGVVFLGEPRTPGPREVHDPGLAMRGSMAILAVACVLVGVLSPLGIELLGPAIAQITGSPSSDGLVGMRVPLASVVIGSMAMLALCALLYWIRRVLLSGRDVREAGTWDCGFGQPTARMQYTASSFAQPITSLFGQILGTKRHVSALRGLYPTDASFETHTPDVFRERFFAPLFTVIGTMASMLRWLERGSIQTYVLYSLLTLTALLAWNLA